MSDEIWKPLPGWEDLYEISSHGRIKSLRRNGQIMKTGTGGPKARYPIAALTRTVYPTIHRLVLETFVGPCPEGMEACHNNGNPADNRVENLRWDTHIANMADQRVHGTRVPGRAPYFIEYDGQRLTPRAWADRFGIKRQILYERIRKGEAPPHCFREPRKYNRHVEKRRAEQSC